MEPLSVGAGLVELAVDVAGHAQQFSWRQGGPWQPLGPPRNAAHISDEGGRGEHASFTGAFVGMVAFDTSGQEQEAQFSRFGYWPG